MRHQTIVALACAFALATPACSMSSGASAMPDRSYATAASDSAFRSPQGDALASGNFGSEDAVVRGSSAESIVITADSDSGFFGGSGGEKSKVEAEMVPPPPPPRPADKRDESPAKEAPPSLPPADPGPATTPGKAQATDTAFAMRAPMLIYTARVNMAVFEVKSSLAEVESLARSLGGFLARRNDQSITIRVPAASFDDAIRRIEKLGDMLSRDVQAEDVTEEFHDTEIRLKNARAVRERLEQLLTKAAKVEESIQIEKELERVAEIIDRLEGRMKFLRDRAAFSTITVTFQPRSAAELGKRPFNLPVPWLYQLGLGRLLSL